MVAVSDVSSHTTIMEVSSGSADNGSSSMDKETSEALNSLKQMKTGKPPRIIRHCMSSTRLIVSTNSDFGCLSASSPTDGTNFLPIFRSGSCSEIGPKHFMEDEHICIDNLVEHLGEAADIPSPGAFYGATVLKLLAPYVWYNVQCITKVFDGHGGLDAASFVRKNILKFIIEDPYFPMDMEKSIKSAYVKVDHAFVDAQSLDNSSGTTALTALIFGRTMVIANAGDCRAVLGKRGRAIELSIDHKPNSSSERLRIEKLGGIIYDGYLNGQLSVARALGDWHMKGPKGSACPLSAEPELKEAIISEEDEFLIMGCDGLWDVMSSQCAVTIARKELMIHNDPGRCSRELVREALKRNTCDNLTVIVICFSPDPPPRIEIPRSRVRRSISADGINFIKGVLESNV
ncbi:hypothetical protein ACLOJK_002435 [Asimina triloba]